MNIPGLKKVTTITCDVTFVAQAMADFINNHPDIPINTAIPEDIKFTGGKNRAVTVLNCTISDSYGGEDIEDDHEDIEGPSPEELDSFGLGKGEDQSESEDKDYVSGPGHQDDPLQLKDGIENLDGGSDIPATSDDPNLDVEYPEDDEVDSSNPLNPDWVPAGDDALG